MLTARRLGKRYGDKRVLRGVDLEVPCGGFLVVTGPNGSGKTTLLRICAGLVAPSEGTVEREVARGELGYLGHEPLVYRELTALENLDLYGRLYRVPERRERIGMLLERFDLWEARHDRVASYSRGMTQRLALCRVLLHDPALLVLDEPYTALDEAGAELLDAQLAELREERTMEGLVLAPCDRSAIWVAKSLATLAFLAAAELVALPLYTLFFHRIGIATVLAVILADLGICAVGTFLGAMAVATRARDLLLPLLFLPLAIPIVVGAVGGSVAHHPGRFLAFLALYDALFAVVCWASFEFVVTE